MTTMNLIGFGRCAAKPAGDLQVGDTLTWNYGYQYRVVSIEQAGAKSIRIVEESVTNGKQFTRRLLKSRLVVAS